MIYKFDCPKRDPKISRVVACMTDTQTEEEGVRTALDSLDRKWYLFGESLQ
jgi:hypothetical protein